MSNIDPAIDGICSMLEEGTVPITTASGERVAAEEEVPTSPQTTQAPASANQPEAQSNGERRRKGADLNVYVNPFPEWSRAMTMGKMGSRKKSGVRCPRCGSCDTRQSLTRGFTDRLLFLFDFINARCRSCNKRFRVFRAASAEQNSKFRDTAPERD